MLKLRAYVDDSASETGDRRLFLAGYINTEAAWATFSVAWTAELAAAPAIAYFKMAEAQNLRGEFRGWSTEARDAKVLALARLPGAFGCWSAHASVGRDDYAVALESVAPAGMKGPYFTVWWMLIDTVARYHASAGLPPEPVDFTFDDQGGVGDDAALWYPWIKASQTDIAPHLGERPVFQDDKTCPPLQAADLLAWHMRRRHERGEEPPAFDLLVGDGRHVYRDLDIAVLKRLARLFKQVPGLSEVQSRSQWRSVRAAAKAAQAAGLGPPNTHPVRMRLRWLRLRIIQILHRWRHPRRTGPKRR